MQNPSVKVLLVDDDTSLLTVATSILKDLDPSLSVDSARSISDALQKIVATSYDVIISDYEMPEKNGLDFLKTLREQNNTTPFILFTGKGREEIAIQALNLGADRYINKHGSPETVYKELAISIHQLYEKSQAKRRLAESEEQLRLIIENAPDAIFICDFSGRLLEQNKQAELLHGYQKHEIVGKNLLEHDIFTPEAVKTAEQMTQQILEGKKVPPTEYTLKRKDGTNIVLEVSFHPLKRGTDIYLLGIARDITERRLAEKEREQKFEALERVAQSLESGLAIISKDYRVIWANSVLQKLCLSGAKHCYEQFNNLNTVCPDCGVKKVFEENVALDVHEFKTKGRLGEPTWVELRVTPLKDNNGNIIGAIELAVPIGARKKVEEALRESEERYAQLAAASFEGILISRDCKVLDANMQFLKLCQYNLEEILGKDVTELLVAPESRELVRQNILREFEGPYEFLGLRKDGTTFPAEARAKAITYKGAPARVSAVRDITEVKKAEAHLAAVNEKLRVIGSITRHDVRNALSVINASVYQIRKKYPNALNLEKYLSTIDSAVTRVNRLFDLTAIYESIGAQEPTEIDVKKCFNDAVALFPNLRDIEIRNETEGLVVIADPLLQHVFYNLIDNSLRHGQNVTRIRLYYIEGDPTKLIYEDNGVGVPEENKDKVFLERFSTDRGTGLGLFITKKIMEVYNWTIQETGVSGKGARFEITIPQQHKVK